jgi:dTMP kinase
LLFSACRAELVAEVIRPALKRDAIVVADRFADSTLAYQGAGRGLAVEELEQLIDIATDGLRPDLTLLLDLPPEAGLDRLRDGTSTADDGRAQLSFFEEIQLPLDWNRFEDEEMAFHQRVRNAYLRLAQSETMRWRLIDATQPAHVVEQAVWEAVRSALLRASTRS